MHRGTASKSSIFSRVVGEITYQTRYGVFTVNILHVDINMCALHNRGLRGYTHRYKPRTTKPTQSLLLSETPTWCWCSRCEVQSENTGKNAPANQRAVLAALPVAISPTHLSLSTKCHQTASTSSSPLLSFVVLKVHHQPMLANMI